jgi:hypothetical protein
MRGEQDPLLRFSTGRKAREQIRAARGHGLELHLEPRLDRRGGQEIGDPLLPGARVLCRQESRIHARQRNQLAQQLLSIRHAIPEMEVKSAAYPGKRLLSILSCGLLPRAK